MGFQGGDPDEIIQVGQGPGMTRREYEAWGKDNPHNPYLTDASAQGEFPRNQRHEQRIAALEAERHTLRVGTIVHFHHRQLGFLLGPAAAIVTRVYPLTPDAEVPATCVDVTIFPQYSDHHTPRQECMVWHRDNANRDRDWWWTWMDEEAVAGEGTD